jgi:hypothetical protein
VSVAKKVEASIFGFSNPRILDPLNPLLKFCYHYGLRLANRLAGPAAHAVPGPGRYGLVKHIEDICRTKFDAFLAAIAAVRIDIDQVNLKDNAFGHNPELGK